MIKMKVWYKRVKERKNLKYDIVTGYRVHLIEEKGDGTWIDCLSMDQRPGMIRKPYPKEVWCFPIDGIRLGEGSPPEPNRLEWEEVSEKRLIRVDYNSIDPRWIGKGGRKALQTILSSSKAL